jgi:hypothetical protein
MATDQNNAGALADECIESAFFVCQKKREGY